MAAHDPSGISVKPAVQVRHPVVLELVQEAHEGSQPEHTVVTGSENYPLAQDGTQSPPLME